jgi:hypothetical protein
MAVTGQVQHWQTTVLDQAPAECLGLAALLHQQVQVGGAHSVEDRGLLGLVVKLQGAGEVRQLPPH